MEIYNTGHADSIEIEWMKKVEQKILENPGNFQALLEKAILLAEPFHQFDQSEELLDFLVEQYPYSVDARFWLAAGCYWYNGDVKKAIPLLENALDLDKKRADCHYLLGIVLLGESQNNFNKAIAAYRKCIELQPTWIAPRQSLAYAFFSAGKFDEALYELEQALKFVPETSEVSANPIVELFEEKITGRYDCKKEILDFIKRIHEMKSHQTTKK